MKAIVCTKYGPPEVLQPADVPKPAPLDNELLIRIHATTCHIGDVRIRGAIIPLWMQLPFRVYMGIFKPKRRILGMELSGVVEAVGSAVRRFKTGDAVLAKPARTFSMRSGSCPRVRPEDRRRPPAGASMCENMWGQSAR